jgi:polyisoprenoid-binding protein YceI
MFISPRISRGARCASLVGVLGAALFWIGPRGVEATEPPAWRVVRGDVRVTCPLTVGGAFEARTASVTGSVALAAVHPVALTGELRVDLAQLDTGISLRNEHLRRTYLEVDKAPDFGQAVLSEIRLGDADAETFQGRTPFSGVLRLHGTGRPILGLAEIRRTGSSLRVEASFPVALTEYGIARPQYLGVGVRDVVRVKVSLVAEPVQGGVGGSR